MRGRMVCVLALLTTSVVFAESSEVVTNPPPAATASMSYAAETNVWTIEGKVSPAFRGFGERISLVCVPVTCELFGGGCSSLTVMGIASPDACGNFAFGVAGPVDGNGNPVPIPPTFECHFLVHVDVATSPAECSNGKPGVLPDFPADPNGTAPCSGGLCPSAP